MIIFKLAEELTAYLNKQKTNGFTIGFVPTMGALHDGHISLINSSVKESNITVCSIFVNPTQFNNADDFKHYPITIEQDVKRLVHAQCSVLFLPEINEIYPPDLKRKHYDLGQLENILEGHFRPNHFQGVCQVVDRLLDIVTPHTLYMGQKDFQQCMVITKLLELTGRSETVQLKKIQTLREKDGLAMSSRNLRLNEDERKKSVSISETLHFIKNNVDSIRSADLKEAATRKLEDKGFVVDYVEIANAVTLEPANDDTAKRIALIAASIGTIRLIDNLMLN